MRHECYSTRNSSKGATIRRKVAPLVRCTEKYHGIGVGENMTVTCFSAGENEGLADISDYIGIVSELSTPVLPHVRLRNGPRRQVDDLRRHSVASRLSNPISLVHDLQC